MRKDSESFADPAKIFQGIIVITVPHMDDEVLACGGTIALLPNKERVHLIYATDGSQSPAPALRSIDSASPDLGRMRVEESKRALKLLGVPEENLHFLNFPEARLGRYEKDFGRSLAQRIKTINPDHVFTPFRYDRHPDHLVVNRATTEALRGGNINGNLFEYFVYHRWRLLPRRDIRKYVDSHHLVRINIQKASGIKREALACFKSQTTRLYFWQDRPILSQNLLDEECRDPESFVLYNARFPKSSIFTSSAAWIRVVHLIETPLKRQKDKCLALIHRFKHRRAGDDVLQN
jgi:LmbE family N-acetylglucosaminyl deacetylase